jgi:hypothetical protein
MPSVVGLLEQRELGARRRVDRLREEADRIQAELAAAEREWQEWAIARSRVGKVLAPADESGQDHAGADLAVDVPLAPVDHLAAVEAATVRADDGVRLDRLPVDHPGCRLRVAAQLLADRRAQPVVELLDQQVVAPVAEERIDPGPTAGRRRSSPAT